MKKLTIPMLAMAGALSALQAHGNDKQIDWSMVPGGHGRNDVSRDFVASPDPLNVILSNSFSAWEPMQKNYAQARTSTGHDQRRAVLGNPNQAVASNVSYTSETVVTTQAAPSDQSAEQSAQAGNQPLYSENANTSSSDTQAQSQNRSQDQNARSSGSTNQTDQSVAATTQTKSDTSNKMADASKMEAKSKLAPHALIIESSLSSAMDQVRGMKGELEMTHDLKKADKMAVQGYKDFIKEMKNDINVARTHERQMMSHIRNYPEVANSSEFKSVNPALRDLQTSLSQWESKASNAQYWNNQQQAKADITNLEKQLSNALDKVKSFNSSQLNASMG
jgi:predicted  nucleic acid-binding Zn-ribbon protein